MKRRAVGLVVAAIAVGPGGARAEGPVQIDDPRYDDHGPGGYVYPTGFEYRPGMYDLRRLTVVREENEVVFRVILDFPIQRPDRVMINPSQSLPLDNEIYFRNVDIFVDYAPGVGNTDGIPGRNVQFRPEEAWDFALVITPQPDLVRQILRGWPPARKIHVADNVRSRGNEVWVRVPIATVGGVPTEESGYQVVVSGALNRNNFEVFQRVTDAFVLNAFTMPVFGVAETEAFGGGALSRWQPRAIDILVPPGITQREILSHYDHDTRTFAVLPMVYPTGGRPVAATTSTTATLPAFAAEPEPEPEPEPAGDGFVYTTVRDVHQQMAILEVRPDGLAPYRVGTVLGDDGGEIGRVVVTAIYPDFVQATIVQGEGRVKRGARVRFDPN
jgi:hypothetical protein